MTTRMPLRLCLNCGAELDAATNVEKVDDKVIPHDGDVSVCSGCGHVMIFENNTPRNPTGKILKRELRDIEVD